MPSPTVSSEPCCRPEPVSEVTLRGKQVSGTLTAPLAIGTNNEQAKLFTTVIPDFGSDHILEEMDEQGIRINVTTGGEADWRHLLLVMLPWLILIFFFLGLIRSSRKMGAD